MKNSSFGELIIVGGANGSGKTTFALDYSKNFNIDYIGADAIAYRLSPYDVQSVRVQAGRQFSKEVNQALTNGKSLVIESTLSGKGMRKTIELAKSKGFVVSIFFVFLNRPALCAQRVQERVAKGGHHVPTKDVYRRYKRSNTNFWLDYRLMADQWYLYSNSGDLVLAAGGAGADLVIFDDLLYNQFKEPIENEYDI